MRDLTASRQARAGHRRPRVYRPAEGEVRETIAGFGLARALQSAPGWAVRGFAAGVALDMVGFALNQSLGRWPGLAQGWRQAIVGSQFWLLGLPVALAAVGVLLAALRRIPAERLAREADARLGLAERVATALETERKGVGGLLVALQRADAIAWLGRLEPFEVFPVRLSRHEGLALAVSFVLLLALITLPDLTGSGGRQSRAADVARAEADRLSALADEVAADEELPAEEREALAQALAQAAGELQREGDAPDRAIASLSQAEQTLARQDDVSAADHELALARLADALDQAAAGREAAQMLDRHNYGGAAQELRRLGQEAAQLAPEDQRALADALRRAAGATSRLDPALSERLRDASATLGEEQGESAMGRAAEEVQRAGQEAARQEMLERALAALQDARQAIGRAERGDGQAQNPRSGQRSADSGAAGAAGQGLGSGEPEERGESATGSGSGEPGDGVGNGGSSAGTGSVRARGESDSGDFRSRQVRVPSSEFEQPQIMAGQQTEEGPIGEAIVDYSQVLTQYRERATEAMAGRYVPLALKELVRDYFSSLDSSR
ncbi:MAG: hypothetical protein HYY04_15040 [Chloroflexi bacterium]|nr:hypothetical protein [Chloroflexota bacterium]